MFLGLSVLDYLLIVLFISYAVTGYRQGLVVSVLSLAGFLIGGALAMWLVPLALEAWSGSATAPMLRSIVLIASVFILASLGQGVAVALGGRLRSQLRIKPAQAFDAALGPAAIDRVVPAQTSRLFAGFREVLDREGFPRVFDGLQSERIEPVAPPDPA